MHGNTEKENYKHSGRLLPRLNVSFAKSVWNQEIWSYVLKKPNHKGIGAGSSESTHEKA